MEITLGQQYNVGEKPTVILYTGINRHAMTPNNIDINTIILQYYSGYVGVGFIYLFILGEGIAHGN